MSEDLQQKQTEPLRKDQTDISSLQDRADLIMAHEGHEKGLAIINERETYKYTLGEEGLQSIEAGMKELGYPLPLDDITPFKWYKAAHTPLSILVARFLFGWTKDDVYKMGHITATRSRVLRTAVALISMRHAFKNVSRLWKTHFDFGEMEGVEYNEEEKFIRIQIHGYHFDGIMVPYLRGFISAFVDRVSGGDSTVTHTQCEAKEGYATCDEYLLDW